MGLIGILGGICVLLVGVLTCIEIEKEFNQSYGLCKRDTKKESEDTE